MANRIQIRNEFIGEFHPRWVSDKVVVDGRFTVGELRQIAMALENYQRQVSDVNKYYGGSKKPTGG